MAASAITDAAAAAKITFLMDAFSPSIRRFDLGGSGALAKEGGAGNY
jgi:hypothetical protein